MAESPGLELRASPTNRVSVPFAQHLASIRAQCQDLSIQHRLGVPPELVRSRIGVLANQASTLFQDRVIEICFLLDQYGVLRYNELRRMLGIISTRTLADKLAFLQAQGFIARTLHDTSPPRVDYQLTPRGRALTDLLFPAILLAAGQDVEEA